MVGENFEECIFAVWIRQERAYPLVNDILQFRFFDWLPCTTMGMGGDGWRALILGCVGTSGLVLLFSHAKQTMEKDNALRLQAVFFFYFIFLFFFIFYEGPMRNLQSTICKIQHHLGLPGSAILKVVSQVSRLPVLNREALVHAHQYKSERSL